MEDFENDYEQYSVSMKRDDIRLLYDCVLRRIEKWEGHPARPASEQEHLWYLRDSLYRMILDYQFHKED